ncbi:hypothetical protein EW146_g806 [Bondarzewia mesenterica]|uniref:tRNA-splicing endonuclease subunit Sen54 N-terminal domain-containing protein n=1 Tax=Bondarzewia mesenterica TaxID=1095465 RepID=A0A4S4M797_9AGAM|nr:hypothetical protein EW146_g806 [Bondarzewia mesenterica]
MDDLLEEPQSIPPPSSDAQAQAEEDEQSSGDEDGGLDWTKLPLGITARPLIPKRGEKDFEPAQGSGLQQHNLDRARTAMFDALRATRAISSKSVSYAIWYPTLARAHVTVARGVHFASMGHSVARPSPFPSSPISLGNTKKAFKRLELLPEEALYLVEKGALFCSKETSGSLVMHEGRTEDGGEDGDEDGDGMQGVPMSVQQAFAEIIGCEGLTLERYQVFSYLRRLGYIVTRARPPSSAYPTPAPYPEPPLPLSSPGSLFRRIFHFIFGPIKHILRKLLRPTFDWWHPLTHRRWMHHNMDYSSIFRSLRIIPSGHKSSLQFPAEITSPPSFSPPDADPYEIFYHLYKPSTPFRKTSPPAPDFSIVVVNARTTPIPTLAQLTRLYESLPTLPPPLPRQRRPPPPSNGIQNSSLFARLLAFLKLKPKEAHKGEKGQERKVNPFMALRQGNKLVVIAAVDAGVISFFRFGEGAFEAWPMA